MTLNTGVKGGTGAGWKRAPKAAPTEPWPCLCYTTKIDRVERDHVVVVVTLKQNPPTWVNCPDCGVRREDRVGGGVAAPRG